MKKILSILFLLISVFASAQNPKDYNDNKALNKVHIKDTLFLDNTVAESDTTGFDILGRKRTAPFNVKKFLPGSVGGGGSGSGTVNTGTANRLAYYPASNTTVDDLAEITANRAVISDANGLPTHSATTATELGYVNGVTSAIQTQLDNLSSGIRSKANVEYATAAALAANTYNNGAGTITMDAVGIVTINGHNMVLNESVLIKNESDQTRNGAYTMTTEGTAGVAGVFTRRSDYNTGAEILAGDNFYVTLGGSNATTTWQQITTGTITLGTSNIVFVQTQGPGTITTTPPVNISGNVVSIDNAAADGSTKGAASFTAADFNASSGNISLDYTNAQKATTSTIGFLTDTDWDTFNGKQAGDADLDTWAGITPGTNVGTFLATPSSANLRAALTDENGTGAALFNAATSPDFTTSITIGSVAVPTISSTNTFTNKRITVRSGTTTSSATPTINTDNVDKYYLTAQAVDITSFTTNLTGTPTKGDRLDIWITGTASRAITWGASFVATSIALPTTTSGTSPLKVWFSYDGAAWAIDGYR